MSVIIDMRFLSEGGLLCIHWCFVQKIWEVAYDKINLRPCAVSVQLFCFSSLLRVLDCLMSESSQLDRVDCISY
jgi:hypothetical protein